MELVYIDMGLQEFTLFVANKKHILIYNPNFSTTIPRQWMRCGSTVPSD